jgi:hypothetical protein
MENREHNEDFKKRAKEKNQILRWIHFFFLSELLLACCLPTALTRLRLAASIPTPTIRPEVIR